MNSGKTWRWEFLGFESEALGQPVQEWFDGLHPDDKYEITDLLVYLQNTTERRWPDEVFDPLRGASGICEIRVPNLKMYRNGEYLEITYRIYGYFGPQRGCYTFLHGTDKDVKNDTVGKGIAEGRLAELGRGEAGVHKFNFKEELD